MDLRDLLLPKGRYFELSAAPSRLELSWGMPLTFDDVGDVLQELFQVDSIDHHAPYVATETSDGIYLAALVDDALVHDRVLPIKLPGMIVMRQDHSGPDPFLESAFENYKKHL